MAPWPVHGSHLRKAPSGGGAQPLPHRFEKAFRTWCARRTLPTNNRLRMFAGRVRRAHQGFPPTWLRGSASPVAVGRGRDGYDREGQGPGEGWPHPAHGPIFATGHPGAVHNLSPHLPELTPRTVGTRPTGRCAGKKRSRARRTGHVDRPCATRHDTTHQHDHFLGAIDARNKRKAPRAESMRGNYGTGAIHLG